MDGVSKDLCNPQEQTKILLELTRRRHIAAQRQQYLPGGHDELRIAEPDLMLFRLGSVQDAVELHSATERPPRIRSRGMTDPRLASRAGLAPATITTTPAQIALGTFDASAIKMSSVITLG